MRKICRNCHFLSKERREENSKNIYCFSASNAEREQAKNNDIDFISDNYILKCYRGVWDEGVDPGKEKRLQIVNDVNRNKKCFFWPYNSAMLFDSAKELQKISTDHEQLKRTNFYTQMGLMFAAIGLILNAIPAILSK
jgi:hypothetical protein